MTSEWKEPTVEEEAKRTIKHLEKMKEEYFKGEGHERHPLPEWYTLHNAIELLGMISKHKEESVTEKMNSESYQALVTHYHELQSERKACLEQINVIEAVYKAIDEEMAKINDILCKYGDHIYEHFEEKRTIKKSEGDE